MVEAGTFTGAAARVHVSQSGVSAQVRELERELGQTLLDRSGRRVRVTDAGAAVLPHARAALASAAGVRQVADDLAGLVQGHVSVGMITACSFVALFDQLEDFHRGHPGIDIALTEDTSDRLVQSVRSGAIDLALVGIGGATPGGLESVEIADEALVAAVPADDPLAARPTIALRELQDRALVCLPRGSDSAERAPGPVSRGASASRCRGRGRAGRRG